MSRHPIEPLSPDERELASRLSRLGQAEPSAALDTAILAAARAAVAPAASAPASARVPPRRDGRWLGWSGISGGLITGVGMAAALVVTVGVVRQLRPQPSLLPARGEQPTQESVVMDTEMVRRQRPPNPPPLPVAEPAPVAAPEVAVRPPRPAVTRARQAAPQAAAAPTAEVDFHDEPLPLPAYQARAGAAAERARRESEATEARESARAERQMAASPPPPAPAVAADAAASAPSAAPPARKGLAASAAAGESTTLDRIEVTGAEALAALPIRKDAELAPVEWLERVRARRQQGDLAGARTSLTLFVRTHPRLRVPDDLRVLLRPQP